MLNRIILLVTGSITYLVMSYRTVHNEKLFSHERLRLILSIIHKMQTPLIMIRNLLDNLLSCELPEPAMQKTKRMLEHTERLMESYRLVTELDRMEQSVNTGFHTAECELFSCIYSIANQCRSHADIRQVRLNVNKDLEHIHCRIDETAMTAALQCFLWKMIDITPSNNSIDILLSCSEQCWSLQIKNWQNDNGRGKRMIPSLSGLMVLYGGGSIRVAKKIVRLHGGKIAGKCQGDRVTIQIVTPLNACCNEQDNKKALVDNKQFSIPHHNGIRKKDDNDLFMDRLEKHLEKNLAKEGYTIKNLCRDMGMSRTSLYSRITEISGKSPAEYIYSFKMRKAKLLLSTGKYNITEIATMLGYCDAKYFGKVFKRYYHASPSHFFGKRVD